MYCWNCGEDIQEAAFCPHCGKPAGKAEKQPGIVGISGIAVVDSVRKWIMRIGHESLAKWIAMWSAVASVVLRFICNEVDVRYTAFVQDLFYVMSQEGKNIVYAIVVFDIVAALLLWYDAKKQNRAFEIKDFVVVAVMAVIQLAVTWISIPMA